MTRQNDRHCEKRSDEAISKAASTGGVIGWFRLPGWARIGAGQRVASSLFRGLGRAALVQMQIPSTLDGELPSRAFAERDREAPILIGARYIAKDREGRGVAGELLSGVVHENQMSVVGVLRLNDGNHIMTKMPITEGELNAYRDSPETFFGAYEPSTKAETPIEV